jgi:hypothetical protein
MRSKRLDEMTMDDVLNRATETKDDRREYWLRVAKAKLSGYRRTMPKLAQFVPNFNWQKKAAVVATQIDMIEAGVV